MTLDLYNAVAGRIQPVDIIALWGAASDPLKPSEDLSWVIEHIAEFRDGVGKEEKSPSHIVVVRQPRIEGRDVLGIESTITHGRNGVQNNPLGAILTGYPKGSTAAWFQLDAPARARVDLAAFYECCGQNEGRTHYSIQQLVQFLLPDWIDQRIVPHNAMVCSVWGGAALRASKAAPDIVPWEQTPADIICLPIFNKPVRIL
jgi:hypothetical protein